MGEKRAYKARKPGGGRKKLKPEYDAGKNLKEQMDAAVALYGEEWSSVLLALKNIKGEVVDRPKALGDIRGVTYIYGMFYRFGLIDVPDEVKEKMGHPKDRKK